MIQFKELLKEAKSKKTVVLAFARMNPVSVGHGLLIDKVLAEAKRLGADHVIYLSATQDPKKNPLNVKQKVYWAKKSFPGANIQGANDKVRTFIEAVKEMDGVYENLVLIAGSDRVPEYQQLLNKYNGRDFEFKSIQVVSAGERDPDAEGAAGMSATKLRNAAATNDYTTFRKGISPKLSDADARKLMQDVRTGMGIKTVAESVFKTSSLRESFFKGEVFNVGEFVRDASGDVFEILDRGSNYVTVCNESGAISKKFINAIEPHSSAIEYSGDFKGYRFSEEFKKHDSLVLAFNELIEQYEIGGVKDAVAILRSIQCIDEAIQNNHKDVDRAVQSLENIGQLDRHKELYMSEMFFESEMPVVSSKDKLRVAKIVADTFGVDASGNNPELMVNSALRSVKGKNIRGDALDMIRNMLSLCAEVGIKFDKNLIPTQLKEDTLDEISQSTLKSYIDKARTSKVSDKKDPLKTSIKRFQGVEKAQDRIHSAELKRIGEQVINPETKVDHSVMHPDEITKHGHSLDAKDIIRKLKVRKLKGID